MMRNLRTIPHISSSCTLPFEPYTLPLISLICVFLMCFGSSFDNFLRHLRNIWNFCFSCVYFYENYTTFQYVFEWFSYWKICVSNHILFKNRWQKDNDDGLWRFACICSLVFAKKTHIFLLETSNRRVACFTLGGRWAL
jgi:hypothetical protein